MSSPSGLLHPQALEDLLMFRLSHLMAVAGAPVIRLCEGQYGITRREWRLIVGLAQHGPMLLSQLAQGVHLDRGRTSKSISLLVAKNLVRRNAMPHDRRQVQLALTETAHTLYRELFPVVTGLNRQLLASLSADQVVALDGILATLQAQAERLPDDLKLPKANRRRGKTSQLP